MMMKTMMTVVMMMRHVCDDDDDDEDRDESGHIIKMSRLWEYMTSVLDEYHCQEWRRIIPTTEAS